MAQNLPAIQRTAAPPALAPSQLTNLTIPDLLRLAEVLVPTGFLPESIKTPAQAAAIMLKGQELRIPPMYALSNIAVVKGKPTISAELMLALIHRDCGQRAIRVKSSDDTQCTVEYRMAGWNDVQTYTFTIEQATKAGLTRNATWTAYPAAMLRARCISAVARMAFPGSIAGMYVPGELGDGVSVDDEGEVHSVTNAQPVSVDVETGEIVDAPQARAAAPGRADPQPDKEYVMKRLHAALAAHDIDHSSLHDYYAAKGFRSVSDVPTNTLRRMAAWASQEGRAAVQGEFRRVLGATDEQPPMEEPGLSDDELRQLSAAIAAGPPVPVGSAGAAGSDKWTH